MTRKFTQSLLWAFLFFLTFFVSSKYTYSQCDAPPSSTYTLNVSNFSITLNWVSSVPPADHYRLRYREASTNTWQYEHNIVAQNDSIQQLSLTGLNQATTYLWQIKSYCSAGNMNASSWSEPDTFTTTNLQVDCYNTPNGTAFIDSCGNCVGGSTGSLACIPFSPIVSVSLSSYECNDTTTLTFSISQDPNEPDMTSSVCSSDSGYFNLNGLNTNDTIGSSMVIAGGGYINVSTTLLVDFIIIPDIKISVKAVDNNTGQIYGSFTIENNIRNYTIYLKVPIRIKYSYNNRGKFFFFI